MKRPSPLVVVSIWVFAVSPSTRADDREAKEVEKLQGAWTLVSWQEGGKDRLDKQHPNLKVMIQKDVLSFRLENQPWKLDLKLKLDPSSTPQRVDLHSTIREGQVYHGIYELVSDELKICWSNSGRPRPESFNTQPGDGRFFLTLKRAKPPSK